jgi:hypothetical protein
MKRFKNSIVICMAAALGLVFTACNDNRNGDSNRMNGGTDTNAINTQRNTSDTINYLTKDSGNKSQDQIDPNPPQNSKY